MLDLSGPEAELAGRTLAELGAQVLKVEPPGGVASRDRPPLSDLDGTSLYWAAVGLGKASTVLDLGRPEDRARLGALAETADVLIESFRPGTMEAWDLSATTLAQRNPRLVHVTVTPFGSGHEKSSWPGTELTLEAASGRMYAQGDRDRPPVPIGHPQAYYHAGVQAAADTVVALHQRELTGRGQHLDVSILAVMVHTQFGAVSGTLLDNPEPTSAAAAAERRSARLTLLPEIWECADGFVAAPLLAGALPLAARIMDELAAAGRLEPDLADIDWPRLPADVIRERIDDDLVRRATGTLAAWFKAHTKSELYRLAFEGDYRLGPLMSTEDMLGDTHLKERGFWQQVGEQLHPGPAVRPLLWDAERPPASAPALGQDGGLLSRWPTSARRGGGAGGGDGSGGGDSGGGGRGESAAFDGLRVVDLSWVAVGPTMGRALADHGATVVRIESRHRLDVGRTLAPFKAPGKGPDDSHWYAHFNAGKLGLALDLSTGEGRQLARRLIVEWADVVLESFSPGTMDKLGLGYPSLAAERADLIMLSASLLGQEGPMATFAGFGQQGVGLAGISTVTGWPDRPPVSLGAYTDVVAPKYGSAALAAALFQRLHTGRGVHLDLSQIEASIRFIEPLVLEQTVNGLTASRHAAASDHYCPHGVYPVAGRHRFIAIAIETDRQWAALVEPSRLASLARTELTEVTGRRAAVAEIESELSDWCARRDGNHLTHELCEAGIPAALVARPWEVAAEASLWERDFFVPLEHRRMGLCHYESQATVFSSGTGRPRRAAPTLGQDTATVLTDILGLPAAEVSRLSAAGVLE